MLQYADFHLTDQHLVAPDFLLLNHTQFFELFEVMERYAGATEMQCTLDFPHAYGGTVFE
jgi:hypothetical protein